MLTCRGWGGGAGLQGSQRWLQETDKVGRKTRSADWERRD